MKTPAELKYSKTHEWLKEDGDTYLVGITDYAQDALARVYDKDEMVKLVDSSLEFWLTSGRYTDEFEKKLAEYLQVRYCSLVNSGSSANLIAFMTLTSPLLGERRVKRGDEIITVAAGFPTTVTPMIQYGAVPVFVDVTIPQYNIDVTKLEEAYSEKTKAVMIAHTLGNPFDLSAVKAFCDKHNLWLVEDNCDALGSRYTIDGEEKLTGSIGDDGQIRLRSDRKRTGCLPFSSLPLPVPGRACCKRYRSD